jgi:hypothetical protein
MPNQDFESVHPPCFTHVHPIPFILPFCRPPRWYCTALPLSWPSIAKEKVSSTKWLQVFKKIFVFIHEVSPFQCLLVFFDSFQFQIFIDSYIFPLVCRSILKTRWTLFLLTSRKTFMFLWSPLAPQRSPFGTSKGKIG